MQHRHNKVYNACLFWWGIIFGYKKKKIKYMIDKEYFIDELHDRNMNDIFEDDSNLIW